LYKCHWRTKKRAGPARVVSSKSLSPNWHLLEHNPLEHLLWKSLLMIGILP
jgi:hypothetical protein